MAIKYKNGANQILSQKYLDTYEVSQPNTLTQPHICITYDYFARIVQYSMVTTSFASITPHTPDAHTQNKKKTEKQNAIHRKTHFRKCRLYSLLYSCNLHACLHTNEHSVQLRKKKRIKNARKVIGDCRCDIIMNAM